MMSEILPEEIQCPDCGADLKLNEQERTERKFACPVCKETFMVKRGERICPNCKAEFIEGITECPECRIPLVETLPEKSEEKILQYVEILSTYNLADIAVIKSILDDGGVDYQLQGEMFNIVEPWVQPVKLLVREDQVELAKELLKEIFIRFMGASATTESENEVEK
jgi:ssDNA-binding Zn-finger/Zn-ribbon topoisomerase 1